MGGGGAERDGAQRDGGKREQPKAAHAAGQLARRRRRSASTAAPSRLTISSEGSSGPSPLPLLEPVSDLRTLAAGDAPPPETADVAPWPAGPVGAGAVARASAAAAAPVGPCPASARWVEDEIAPAPGEPVAPALPPGGLPAPPTGPPTRWTVFDGCAPPAVGTVSRYWPTPELPGGAIV